MAPSEAEASAVRANRCATERAMIPAVEPSSRERGSSVSEEEAAVAVPAVSVPAAAEEAEETETATGGAASPSFPHIVYVFPDPVCP